MADDTRSGVPIGHAPVAGEEPIALPRSRSDPLALPDDLARVRDAGEPVRLAFPDGHLGWLVTRHATVRRVLSDRTFSARAQLLHELCKPALAGRPATAAPPGQFGRLDAPEHDHYRRKVTGRFARGGIAGLIPRIEEITTEHLDALARSDRPADLIESFATPTPATVICELLGVPTAEYPRLMRHALELDRTDLTPERDRASTAVLLEIVQAAMRAKRAEPADDVISDLVTDDELTDDEIIGTSALLLMSGLSTTANMLALGVHALLSHRDQLDALLSGRVAMSTAIEELLRYQSIVQYGLRRVPTEDVELDGRLIRAGETVVASLPAASRDPAQFPDPDTLDLTRTTTGHLGFGYGFHMCLGKHLARAELEIALTGLLRRFPTLRLATDDPPLTETVFYGLARLPVSWDPPRS